MTKLTGAESSQWMPLRLEIASRIFAAMIVNRPPESLEQEAMMLDGAGGLADELIKRHNEWAAEQEQEQEKERGG